MKAGLGLLRNGLRLFAGGGGDGPRIGLLGGLENSILLGRGGGCSREMRILLWFLLVWLLRSRRGRESRAARSGNGLSRCGDFTFRYFFS